MKILLLHTRYREHGGEDSAFEAERDLLASRGHEVAEFIADNAEQPGDNGLSVATQMLWSAAMRRRLLEKIDVFKPDLMHVHNTFWRMSPAVYFAAKARGVPVVQTLHNYRLLCVNALLYRNARPCEDCVGAALPWRGVVHRCYRESRGASAAVAAMVGVHRALGTWTHKIDRYIALSEFARGRLMAGGLPADKITVKPNFVVDAGSPGESAGAFGLYAGRLSAEKGIETLLAAWSRMGRDQVLQIAGDGPLRERVLAASATQSNIRYLGARTRGEVMALMREALFVVAPSQCYENFPMVVTEALSAGRPVLCSALGALAEIVRDGVTGLQFAAGDAQALAMQAQRLYGDRVLVRQLGLAARQVYLQHYTPERSYQQLMDIYAGVTGC